MEPGPVDVDNAGFHHFVIEVVALAGALADAGEHRVAAMRLGDVVDQFHDDHGLADPGAAEQPDLAAFRVRRQQIDHLDPGDQDFGFSRLIDEFRRRFVDRGALLGDHGAALVDRLADDVEDAAERLWTDRHHDRLAGIDDLSAPHQPVRRVHRNRAHDVLAELLRHFEDQCPAAVIDLQCAQDCRQLSVKMHIDDGADDLGDGADRIPCHTLQYPRAEHHSASAPEMISISSLVIAA